MNRSILSIALCLFASVHSAPILAQPVAATRPAVEEPASTDLQYTIAAGDKMRISIFGEAALTGDYTVTSGGNLPFPLIGNVAAAGNTVEQLQEMITAKLSDGFLRDPKVSIQMLTYRPFYILGEVNRPGEYPVSTGLTIAQAVASAGGFTYRANTRRAFLKRTNDVSERPVDIRGREAVVIQAGDTIRIRERHF